MDKLTRSPALGAAAHNYQDDGISIAENPSLALASIAARLGQKKQLLGAVKKLTGLNLPDPQRLVAAGDYTIFWTGPEQWFVTAPINTHEDIEMRLRSVLGASASVTEQTGGWTRFDVEGDKLAAMFERLCMIDLATTPPHHAIRTVIEHIGAFVITWEGGTVSVLSPRSYAGSLFHAMTVAAKSV